MTFGLRVLMTYQGLVADEFPGEPEEGLLEVVVGLRRDLEVLDALLSVEGDVGSLHFPLLYIIAIIISPPAKTVNIDQ